MAYPPKTPSLSSIESAIQLLSRRDHGRYELCQKLQMKGYDELEVEKALQFCIEHQYLDDLRFARSQVRQAIYKGHGERRIRQELMQKRVEESAIDQALTDEATDWFELARQVALKKYKGHKAKEAREYAKQVRFLQYRGYSYEQIEYALSAIKEI
ncbi:recombination regulator RecX [Vibrio sp. S4M6]|uniref:recombination regulator RecX n=1 Tax=Vibrio sinus TaxID=2946865 RepID=UPI002029B550|nr:recombination regulator RecX [Vibrio sinus]MCL9780988.1 recombination regulator RecX [Vibrio sinus]